jgi:hypothetical protein
VFLSDLASRLNRFCTLANVASAHWQTFFLISPQSLLHTGKLGFYTLADFLSDIAIRLNRFCKLANLASAHWQTFFLV